MPNEQFISGMLNLVASCSPELTSALTVALFKNTYSCFMRRPLASDFLHVLGHSVNGPVGTAVFERSPDFKVVKGPLLSNSVDTHETETAATCPRDVEHPGTQDKLARGHIVGEVKLRGPSSFKRRVITILHSPKSKSENMVDSESETEHSNEDVTPSSTRQQPVRDGRPPLRESAPGNADAKVDVGVDVAAAAAVDMDLNDPPKPGAWIHKCQIIFPDWDPKDVKAYYDAGYVSTLVICDPKLDFVLTLNRVPLWVTQNKCRWTIRGLVDRKRTQDSKWQLPAAFRPKEIEMTNVHASFANRIEHDENVVERVDDAKAATSDEDETAAASVEGRSPAMPSTQRPSTGHRHSFDRERSLSNHSLESDFEDDPLETAAQHATWIAESPLLRRRQLRAQQLQKSNNGERQDVPPPLPAETAESTTSRVQPKPRPTGSILLSDVWADIHPARASNSDVSVAKVTSGTTPKVEHTPQQNSPPRELSNSANSMVRTADPVQHSIDRGSGKLLDMQSSPAPRPMDPAVPSSTINTPLPGRRTRSQVDSPTALLSSSDHAQEAASSLFDAAITAAATPSEVGTAMDYDEIVKEVQSTSSALSASNSSNTPPSKPAEPQPSSPVAAQNRGPDTLEFQASLGNVLQTASHSSSVTAAPKHLEFADPTSSFNSFVPESPGEEFRASLNAALSNSVLESVAATTLRTEVEQLRRQLAAVSAGLVQNTCVAHSKKHSLASFLGIAIHSSCLVFLCLVAVGRSRPWKICCGRWTLSQYC